MDNVFVIGDVHGHIDRLEALLKQEGLLAWCHLCQGSGLRHPADLASQCEKCLGEGTLRVREDVTVIQLGDLGHFGVDGSPTADLLAYKYVTKNRWADVVLWGNHDRALVDPNHAFGGFTGARMNREVGHYINILMEEGRLMLAMEAHDFLITHAGLAAAFKQQKVPAQLKTDPAAFADWINDEDEKFLETKECDKNAWGIRDAISRKRGGSGSVGGILWRDIDENLYDGFRQVFGHSADHKEHAVRYCWKGGYTRKIESMKHTDQSRASYCIDIGGKGDLKEDQCLAGTWLPSETIVRVDL